MDEKKGLIVGSTYRISSRAKEFVYYIAEAERAILREALTTTKFLAVMTDGSTDSTVTPKLGLFMKVQKLNVIIHLNLQHYCN